MATYIKLTRIPTKKKIDESEFNITKLLIDALGVDYESNYLISFDDAPIICGDKYLAFTEQYKYIDRIPKDLAIFRPIRNEKHANIIIDMFDELELIDADNIEVTEFIKGNKKKFSGYLKNGNEMIEESFVKSAPSIPILKISIIAKILFDDDEYNSYIKNLTTFLNRKKGRKYNEKG